MALFVEVLSDITLPIIALIAFGWILQPFLKFDVSTINRLLIYVIVPAFLFHYLTTTTIPVAEAWPTALFIPVQMLLLGLVGWLVASLFKMPEPLRLLFGLVTAFSNTGNYSIPLIKYAFPPEFILHQTIIFAISAIAVFSVVAWIMKNDGVQTQSVLSSIVSTPMIPAIALGLAMNAASLSPPEFVLRPLGLLGQAFIPLALFALGAQLSHNNGKVPLSQLSLAVVLKLMLAPAIVWGMASLAGFVGLHHNMLVVSASAPTAIILSVLQTEFKKSDDPFLPQAIFITTVLSPIFITGWVILTRLN